MTRTISRILVATDFSAPSACALEYAITLADRFDASLHLLHAIEDPIVAAAWAPEAYIGASAGFRAGLIDDAARRLACQVTSADRHRLTITSEVRLGPAAQTIEDAADDQRCDLIVMGTHGRTGMAHLLLGSVAEKVVRRARCPVLTVRGDAAAVAAEHEFFAHQYVPSE
jgi:universal stress protein A